MAIRKDKKNKRQPAWILDYRNENNKRRRLRVYCTKSVAETKYGLIISEIEKRKMGLSNGDLYLLLKDLVMKYLLASETDGKSSKTVKRIKNSTDAFIRILGENIPITEITQQMIEKYKQNRLNENTPRGTKLTRSALNSELKHLKAMFNWALKLRILSRSPFLGIKFVKVEEKPIRFLSTDELKSLLAIIESAHDDEMFDLVQFYLQTGARASELLKPKFTWKSVDLQRGIIILIGKKRKRRTLPLNDLLKNMLQGRENIGSPFEFTYNQVYRRLKKYYKIAKIENASVHTLRKTCGAILIQKGVDIYRVSKWLGHSTVTVTENHYVDLLKSDYDDISLLLNNSSSDYTP